MDFAGAMESDGSVKIPVVGDFSVDVGYCSEICTVWDGVWGSAEWEMSHQYET